LHDNGIILKNLESTGILMNLTDDHMELDKSIPRISRLSKANIINYEGHVHELVGDIRFRAPEVVSNKQYGLKADSWSFGIILFQLITGTVPFNYVERKERKANATPSLNKDYPENYAKENIEM
jgi:serine/threonine protein kinase